MNDVSITSFLICCTIITYAVLMVWFAVFVFAHDTLYRVHSRCFRLSVEEFDVTMYRSMAIYKLGILLLNISPLLAILILR